MDVAAEGAVTATREELEGMLGRSRRLALRLGAKAHRRLAEARAAGVRGGDRIALRLVDTALFSTRARALVQLLREQGAAS